MSFKRPRTFIGAMGNSSNIGVSLLTWRCDYINYVRTTNNEVDTHLSVINTNYEVERCISPEYDFEVFIFHERTLCVVKT